VQLVAWHSESEKEFTYLEPQSATVIRTYLFLRTIMMEAGRFLVSCGTQERESGDDVGGRKTNLNMLGGVLNLKTIELLFMYRYQKFCIMRQDAPG
jgi:hypothetical protein